MIIHNGKIVNKGYNIDPEKYPETYKLLKWIEDEKEKRGLIDIDVFINPKAKEVDLEDFCREVNALHEAPCLEPLTDKDI